MGAGAQAGELALPPAPLWMRRPDTAEDLNDAEPRRAAATLPRFEGGRHLEARYYEAIGADPLGRPVIEAAVPYDLISGWRWNPAGWRSLDAAKAAAGLRMERSRSAVSSAATFHFEIVAGNRRGR
jgi:hypothetical protein